MVSTSTQTLVLEVVDAQMDFNIKLIILGCIIFYAFLLNYLSNKTEVDSFAKSIFVFASKIYIAVTVFFAPLASIMLFREYAAIDLWTLLITLYSVVFVVTAIALTIFSYQKILDIVGVDVQIESLKRDQKRKGEQ
ncbi:MAG: hypothetical protein MJK08_14630 [Campylobacterales bacterium]|nr:hypothetical protein [Campylobacterales bacterium]